MTAPEPKNPLPEWYAWIDIETTGKTERDAILEFAIGLARTSDPYRLVLPVKSFVAEFDVNTFTHVIDPVVRTMHTENNLFASCRMGSAIPIAEIDRRVSAFLECAIGEDRAIIAGFSAHFDLRFISRRMPLVAEHLNDHRVFDVTAHKLLARSLAYAVDQVQDFELRLNGKVYTGEEKRSHRATDDLLAAVHEGWSTAVWLTNWRQSFPERSVPSTNVPRSYVVGADR